MLLLVRPGGFEPLAFGVGELWHPANNNDTAPEIVQCAQLPALVCVWNKQCWIVKFTHQNSWKKKSGQMVVSQPSRVASLQTRLKRLIQKGGHTVKCLACGGG